MCQVAYIDTNGYLRGEVGASMVASTSIHARMTSAARGTQIAFP